jgi:hypothetical protein
MNTEKFKTTLPTETEINSFSREQIKEVRQTMESHNEEYRRGILHGDLPANWRHAKTVVGPLRSLLLDAEHRLSAAEKAAAEAKKKSERPTDDMINEAKFELRSLSGSKEFWEHYNDPSSVGHAHAKKTYARLHKIVAANEPAHSLVEGGLLSF